MIKNAQEQLKYIYPAGVYVYFGSSLQLKGFGCLGRFWKRHSARVPAKIRLRLGSILGPWLPPIPPPEQEGSTGHTCRQHYRAAGQTRCRLPSSHQRWGREDASKRREGGAFPFPGPFRGRRPPPPDSTAILTKAGGADVRHTKHRGWSVHERSRTLANENAHKGESYIRQDPGATRGRVHAKTHTWTGDAPRTGSRLQNARPREEWTRTPRRGTVTQRGATHTGHRRPRQEERSRHKEAESGHTGACSHARAEGPLAYQGCHPPDESARAAGGCAHKGATPTLAQTPGGAQACRRGP